VKTRSRYSSIIRCDIVTVIDTPTDVLYEDKCDKMFHTNSVTSVAREQAAGSGWQRVPVGRVRWPGDPPAADAKKVDVCPEHRGLVITKEEAATARKERKAKEKADAKAEKKRQRDEARKVARAAKAAKKPKRSRRKEAAHA
jgi:hypothetical protein